jgi:hypothetical protein
MRRADAKRPRLRLRRHLPLDPVEHTDEWAERVFLEAT